MGSDRFATEEMATPNPGLDSKASQVLDTIRELLLEIGSQQAAANVSLSSSLNRDLGLGSLERVELLVRMERRFQCRLADDIAQAGGNARRLVAGDRRRWPGNSARGPLPNRTTF